MSEEKKIYMAKDKDSIVLNGIVKECFPNTTFKVVCDNGHELLAYLAGKMRRFFIKVLPGDKVAVEISPYDLTRGRIISRINDKTGQQGGSQGGSHQGGGTPTEGGAP